MHVEGPRGNFQAQKERRVNSVERIPGPSPSLHTQTEVLRTWNYQAAGVSRISHPVALKAVET